MHTNVMNRRKQPHNRSDCPAMITAAAVGMHRRASAGQQLTSNFSARNPRFTSSHKAKAASSPALKFSNSPHPPPTHIRDQLVHAAAHVMEDTPARSYNVQVPLCAPLDHTERFSRCCDVLARKPRTELRRSPTATDDYGALTSR
jgi:hypothetical protein